VAEIASGVQSDISICYKQGGQNMKFEAIKLVKENHMATVTLSRPDRRNALNRQMLKELVEALEDISGDDEIRVMILTGAGKAFCAGADVDIMSGGDDEEELGAQKVETLRRSFAFRAAKKIILGLHQMEKPTIAMINGVCVGAGLDLALACDLKIASDKAKFMCGFVKIGLFPGFGATWLYPRAMGLAKGLEMLFTGDMLTAKEAGEIGMINKLSSPEELENTTLVMAGKIAGGPPIAIRLMKSQVYKGLATDLNTALDEAAVCESITLASADHIEGITAFREQRPPSFKGN
jgi:Enoyl-CoA hydratase/carnithine racemase